MSISPSLRHILCPRFPLSRLTHLTSFRHRLFSASPPQTSPLEVAGEDRQQALELIDVNPPRGTRDFPLEEMWLRNWLFQNFREVSLILSFEEVDFPVLESEALFIRKAGEEITQQTSIQPKVLKILGSAPACEDSNSQLMPSTEMVLPTEL